MPLDVTGGSFCGLLDFVRFWVVSRMSFEEGLISSAEKRAMGIMSITDSKKLYGS